MSIYSNMTHKRNNNTHVNANKSARCEVIIGLKSNQLRTQTATLSICCSLFVPASAQPR